MYASLYTIHETSLSSMKKASLDSTFLCKSKKKDGDDGNLSGDKNVMEDGSTSMYWDWQSIGQIYA